MQSSCCVQRDDQQYGGPAIGGLCPTSETWFGNIFRIDKQLRDIFCMNRYTYEPILVTAHVDIQLLIGKFLQTAPSKLMHPLINPQIEFNFGESLQFSENWRILRECLRCT